MARSRKKPVRRKAHYNPATDDQIEQMSLEEEFLENWSTFTTIPLIRQEGVAEHGDFVGNSRFSTDFTNHQYRVVLEVNGGTGKGKKGAHSSRKGLNRDYHRQNMFTNLGYKYYEFDSDMVSDKEYIAHIVHCIESRWQVKPISPQAFDSYGIAPKKRTAQKRCVTAIKSIQVSEPLTSREWKKEIDDLYAKKYKRKRTVGYACLSEALKELGYVKKNVRIPDTKTSKKVWIKESST